MLVGTASCIGPSSSSPSRCTAGRSACTPAATCAATQRQSYQARQLPRRHSEIYQTLCGTWKARSATGSCRPPP